VVPSVFSQPFTHLYDSLETSAKSGKIGLGTQTGESGVYMTDYPSSATWTKSGRWEAWMTVLTVLAVGFWALL
jgi:hypothetical protein